MTATPEPADPGHATAEAARPPVVDLLDRLRAIPRPERLLSPEREQALTARQRDRKSVV